jgi:hypothetical protein
MCDLAHNPTFENIKPQEWKRVLDQPLLSHKEFDSCKNEFGQN